MVIKGPGGVYRQENRGIMPTLKMNGEGGRQPFKAERNQHTTKVAVDLIRRAGYWIVFEEAGGVYRIDVIGHCMGFNGKASRQEILKRFDEWAADEEARIYRRRSRAY